MEDALGGAAVLGRVVADPLGNPVGSDDVGFEGVGPGGQAEHPGDPVTLQGEGTLGNEGRQTGDRLPALGIAEMGAEEGIDPGVGGRQVVGKEADPLPEVREQGFSHFEEGEVAFLADDRKPAGGELQVHKITEGVGFGVAGSIALTETEAFAEGI